MARISIGIAGYMGSGKTTCCRMLAAQGNYRVVDGDAEAKNIMAQNPALQRQLSSAFGPAIIENGLLSFKKLGAIVFGDLEKLLQLNAIVHPLLSDRLQNMIFKDSGKVVVIDAALLPLWSINERLTLRIWIEASFDVRLSRLMQKGLALSEEEIRMRMKRQESLFAPPPADTWRYVVNESGVDLLYATVVSCITGRNDGK